MHYSDETLKTCCDQNAKIFSCDVAAAYQPTNDKTVLIRIMDSFHKKLDIYPHFQIYPPLQYQENFYKIIELYYDDVDRCKWKSDEEFERMCKEDDAIPFCEDIARELIVQIETATMGNPKEYDLVVHCRAGVARSTATYIALNEIYDLGYEKLKELYPQYNRQVYETLINLSK